MPLLGNAALLLSFGIAPQAVSEHDDWHSHEHLPERLSIPGFIRGSRWVSQYGAPRYLVMYEVEDLATLSSQAYLDRLNQPSPWTSQLMPHYQGMRGGLCAVTGSSGSGLGASCLLLRFAPAQGAEPALRHWLCAEALPALCARPGLVSAHLFESGPPAVMTQEQSIRGADAGFCWAPLVTAYRPAALAQLEGADSFSDQLAQRGALDLLGAAYQLMALLGRDEVDTGLARRTPAQPGVEVT